MTDQQNDQTMQSREEGLREAEALAQSADYWTLAQAAAWVMFRDMSIVARFTAPRVDQWVAYLMYPRDWTKRPVLETWHDLLKKLGAGLLASTGRRSSDGVREPIPAMNWADLVPEVDAGPYVSDGAGRRVRPWTDILVVRADMERLWRRPSEVEGRSKYSKEWFQDRYRQLKEANPGSSKNELMEELSDQFQEETKRNPPARSTIQGYLTGV